MHNTDKGRELEFQLASEKTLREQYQRDAAIARERKERLAEKDMIGPIFGGGIFAISLARLLGASAENADLIGLPAIVFIALILFGMKDNP